MLSGIGGLCEGGMTSALPVSDKRKDSGTESVSTGRQRRGEEKKNVGTKKQGIGGKAKAMALA